jgi:hypothetical protein
MPKGCRGVSAGVVAAAVAVTMGATSLGAHSFEGGVGEPGVPAWMTAWSPFTLSADLPRTLGPGSAIPSVLDPAPRLGLFWTRGNPGALPFEVLDEWAGFRGSRSDVSGDYRRPLDAGDAAGFTLSALGWRALGERGAVIGRVVLDQRDLGADPGMSVRPYGSSPYTAVDTAAVNSRHVNARLEGAGGWRLGRFGIGVGAGFEGHDHRTSGTGKPRLGRAALPAASAGVATHLGPDVRIGTYGRWSGFAETSQSLTVSETGVIHGIRGLREPETHVVGSASPYFLRIEHDHRSVGVNAVGSALGTAWTTFIETGRFRQESWNDQREDSPPANVWKAEGWVVGASVQRPVTGLLWTLDLRWKTLSGDATLADGEDPDFEADEGALSAALEARAESETGAWGAAARAFVEFQARERVDMAAELREEVESLTWALAGSVARRLGTRTRLSGGLTYASYRTRGPIPRTVGEGPGFQAFVAPEILLRASPARAWGILLEGRHELRTGVLLGAFLRRDSLSLGEGGRALPFTPSGDRTATSLGLTVTLR